VATLPLFCCEDRRGAFIDVFRRSAAATGHDLRLFAPRALPPADFATLVAHYHHLSPNPAAFELAVFRRYFEVRDAIVGTGVRRFVIADSDLLLLGSPAELPAAWRDSDAVVGSIGVTAGVAETDISPHFSCWTPALLGAFCDFVVRTYRDDIDQLRSIHAARIAARQPLVSISDMTLLALWVAADAVPFIDSNRVIDGRYLDHNIGMAACAGTVFDHRLGRKSLSFDGGSIALRTTAGAVVRPLLLHFVGRNKRAMAAVEARSRSRLAAHTLTLAAARGVRTLVRR